MSSRERRRCFFTPAILLLLFNTGFSQVQEKEPPEKTDPEKRPWSITLGAGLTLNSGNSGNRSLNTSFEICHEIKQKNKLKFDGLYLYADSQGKVNTSKFTTGLRDEHTPKEKLFFYAEVRFMRDTIKEIHALWTPTTGVGWKAIKKEGFDLSIEGGIGGAVEKNLDLPQNSSFALRTAETMQWKISKTALFTQACNAVWKTNDFSDAIYHFECGLTLSILKKLEFKVSFIDDYKSKLTDPVLKKNDTSLILAMQTRL